MNKRVMLVVTEGETDREFYKKMLQHIRAKLDFGRLPFDNIEFECAKGIGNMQNKIIRIIARKMFSSEDKENVKRTIVLCYDRDVFEYNQNPPIDRDKLVKDILNLGDCDVIKIEANRMIEDFFLYDFENIRKFLRLKKSYKLKLKGYEGLKKMFKDSGKTYFKGERVEGFIDKLEMDVIIPKISNEIREFCELIGYNV